MTKNIHTYGIKKKKMVLVLLQRCNFIPSAYSCLSFSVPNSVP